MSKTLLVLIFLVGLFGGLAAGLMIGGSLMSRGVTEELRDLATEQARRAGE
ncbi:hypothetical protein HY478_01350 [Candidatus Uhrbacteria bacterium]|nr:hypothetical protein [Candidatus Uhrbacteria bacterium]